MGGGGFWASPTNTSFGWKQIIKKYGHEAYTRYPFLFILAPWASVIYITDQNDIAKVPMDGNYIDFEKARGYGFDAIELRYYDIKYDKNRDPQLTDWNGPMYEWSCDSILIMNPEIIIPVRIKNKP